MAKMKIGMIAMWVAAFGALNVGLGAFGFDIVGMIPVVSDFANIVNIAVGAAGAVVLLNMFNVTKL